METYTRQQTGADAKDDPRARALLKQAFEKTARWQSDFKGFTADLTANINGKESRGTVTVKGPRDVKAALGDPEAEKWTEGQLAMIAVHRGPRSFEEADGKYALTLGEDTDHPLGLRLIIHGDGMQSFYRIQDGRITQINRKTPHIAFTINVEDSVLTQDGKFITTRYTVYYFSPQDGKLANVESFTDHHARVASSDLPASRRIISYENGEIIVRTLTFSNHKML
jgi:hypothetical protein